LKWTAGGVSTFRTGASHVWQTAIGSSLKRCITSKVCPCSHLYS
jgi:hypothetical protein